MAITWWHTRFLKPLREARSENQVDDGHLDRVQMIRPSIRGFAGEAFDILDGAKLGPSGGPHQLDGCQCLTQPHDLSDRLSFVAPDPRFLKLCARLGLVEYWLETLKWPDCAEVVPYDSGENAGSIALNNCPRPKG